MIIVHVNNILSLNQLDLQMAKARTTPGAVQYKI